MDNNGSIKAEQFDIIQRALWVLFDEWYAAYRVEYRRPPSDQEQNKKIEERLDILRYIRSTF